MIDLNTGIELPNHNGVYLLKDFINDISSINHINSSYDIILENIFYDKAEIINLFVKKLDGKMTRLYIDDYLVNFGYEDVSEYIYKEYNANKKNKNPINNKKDDKVDKIDSNKSSDKIILDEEIYLTN